MLFSDIQGHENLKRQLTSSVLKDKAAQAVLFYGPEGNASLPLALAYSQYLNCQEKGESDSCNKCASCIKASKFIHPDIHFTFPVVSAPSKPSLSNDFIEQWREALREEPYMNIFEWMNFIGEEKKVGNISTAECRNIIRQLSLKSFEGDYKVYLIWGAETLGNSGNVLLKIIEEPPPNTVFILITYNKPYILNTIISRVQNIKVNKFSDEEVSRYLAADFDLDEKEAAEISRLVDGNMLFARQMTDNRDLLKNDLFLEWMKDIFRIVLRNDKTAYVDLYKWVEDISRFNREQHKVFCKYALFFIHETILNKPEVESRLNEDERKLSEYLMKNYNAESFYQMQTIFNEMYYHVERNAHSKTLFLSNSLKLKNLLTQVSKPVNI